MRMKSLLKPQEEVPASPRETIGQARASVGQTELAASPAIAHTPVVGSEEQQAVWHEAVKGYGHILSNSVAGSGKTFVAQHSARKIKAQEPGISIGYLVFGKANRGEMQEKAGDVLESLTYHALGRRAIVNAFGNVKLNADRMWGIIDSLHAWKREGADPFIRSGIKRISSIAKQYDIDDPDSLAHMIDHHDIDLMGVEQEVIGWIPAALKKAADVKGEIDYDDMPWVPKRLNLSVPKFDFCITDESQDLDPVQQWLVVRSAERVMVIGDRNQAIFGFRGASVKGMDLIAEELRLSRPVGEYPLTINWRCPKSHIAMAQKLVPHIKAADHAPEGIERSASEDQIKTAKPGDLIMCRVNAPLIQTAYSLISAGVPAVVKGKDLVAGLQKLIDKAAKTAGTLKQVLDRAEAIVDRDVDRFLRMPDGKGEARAAAAQDRLQCLLIAAKGCRTANDLKRKLESMFTESRERTVVLGTVHGCKGLEAERVWILQPELLPHPMAKKEWERQQELNLLYVAVTRAKYTRTAVGELISVGELIFVGDKPTEVGGPVRADKKDKKRRSARWDEDEDY